jgi:hypothetical protein
MVRGINVDLSFLFRKKKFDQTSVEDTKLSRVLGLMDITALGVSCTLGNGIYVLAGNVIANYSGPSIFLSFLIAGFATFIAGEFFIFNLGIIFIYFYLSFNISNINLLNKGICYAEVYLIQCDVNMLVLISLI